MFTVPMPQRGTEITEIKAMPRLSLLDDVESATCKATRKLGGNDVSHSDDTMNARKRTVNTVKTLRRVKRIKIEEQNYNTNKTVILERCRNPETCPTRNRPSQDGERPRPHFHKVRIKNSDTWKNETKPSASTSRRAMENLGKSEKAISNVRTIDENLEESSEDNSNTNPGDEDKSRDDMRYKLETYLINVTRDVPEKEMSDVSQYRKTIARSVGSGRKIDTAKGESMMIPIPDYISKKHPATTELVREYYRTKDERIFDRCAYVNCKNGRYTTGSRLFRFPQRSDSRLNTWIKNAGNPRMLYWSSATIRRAGLCGDHFTVESFFNDTRQRLLRTALPKPFHLDSNSISGTELQRENLTRDDLLRIFDGLDECPRNGTESALIDLPDEKLHHPDDLKIKYPFEDVATPDENAESVDCANFAIANIKNEPPDDSEDHGQSVPRGDSDIKTEFIEVKLEADALPDDVSVADDDLNFQQQEDIRGILALRRQKIELRKTIKRFSAKLERARARKKELRSQLLAYSESVDD